MSSIPPQIPLEADRRDPLPSGWKRGVLIVVFCAGLAVVASFDTLHAAMVRLLTPAEAIIAAHPVWGMLLIVLFVALSAMLAFVSSAVIVPLAIQTWGEPLTILLLWSGWTIGGICAYGLGRFLGRPVVKVLTFGAALARFERRFSGHAPFSLVLLFQTALPSEVPGYLLGLLRYTFAKFVAAIMLAELPFAVATVYLGASFLGRRTFLMLGLGAAAALFSTWAFYRLQKRLSA